LITQEEEEDEEEDEEEEEEEEAKKKTFSIHNINNHALAFYYQNTSYNP